MSTLGVILYVKFPVTSLPVVFVVATVYSNWLGKLVVTKPWNPLILARLLLTVTKSPRTNPCAELSLVVTSTLFVLSKNLYVALTLTALSPGIFTLTPRIR